MDSVARIFAAYRDGDREAFDRLVSLVSTELRSIAAAYLARERIGHTLQPTALVNEAYLRMLQAEDLDFENRSHFFGIAARLMRQVLVDHARKHHAERRGGRRRCVTLTEWVAHGPGDFDVDLLLLDDALERLGEKDERLARIVDLRYFGGLSVEETAEVMGCSARTIKRDWAVARVWLRDLMNGPAT